MQVLWENTTRRSALVWTFFGKFFSLGSEGSVGVNLGKVKKGGEGRAVEAEGGAGAHPWGGPTGGQHG